MKIYVEDVLAKLGEAKAYADMGENQHAKEVLESLTRDIVTAREAKAPGVAGELLELTTKPEEEDVEALGDETGYLGATATEPPPIPGPEPTPEPTGTDNAVVEGC